MYGFSSALTLSNPKPFAVNDAQAIPGPLAFETVGESVDVCDIDLIDHSDSVKKYCFCQTVYNPNKEYIGCDGDYCKYEWFHLKCVELDSVPEGKWFCSYCSFSKKLL